LHEQGERIVITRVGGPEVLEIRPFVPAPPAPGEVVLEVGAVGLNFADIACRLGLYQAAPPIPFVPGLEVAGVVVARGEGVDRPAVGERVIAVTRFGGYTTRLNVAAELTRPLPEGWSFAQGAAFPVVFLTAWHGLVNVGRLARGETVVVHSAAGGVGTAACQIARDRGARVIGTVGSERKRTVAAEAGADPVLVSPHYDVWADVDRVTEGRGVDIVFDAVGGRGLRHGYRRLRPGGRLIVYGFAEMMPAGGWRNWPLLVWKYLRTPRFAPFYMTTENRTVSGFNLIYMWERLDLFDETWSALMALAREDRVRPVIGATLPFEKVGEAQTLLQSRGSTGKVVLVREPQVD